MASSNRLSELASIIQKNSARIDEHVSSELTTSTSITPTTRDEILGCQTAVLNATDELRSLVVDQVGTHQEVISDQVRRGCKSQKSICRFMFKQPPYVHY